MGAVIVKKELADEFQDISEKEEEFPHGFTAGGHPVGCAIALKAIDIIINEGLLDNVKYDATDSIIINQKDNKISLYNNAKIIYGDIELTSGLIILDYKKNEVYAGRISDNKGNLSQYPVFKQGGNTVNPDSVSYTHLTLPTKA